MSCGLVTHYALSLQYYISLETACDSTALWAATEHNTTTDTRVKIVIGQ